MKKIFCLNTFIALFFLLPTSSVSAQYLEAGFNIGGANYLGDLAPSSLWTSVGDVNLSGGVMVRINWVDWVTFRAGYQYGSIEASDANAKNAESRRKRNLSFRSVLHELHLTTEINIFGYRPYKSGRGFAPFLFAGISAFKFNPQAEWNGQWYDLQPLGTEGQGLAQAPARYKRVQLAIPAGIGFKFALSPSLNLGLEVGMRKTFTDYLDDVSTNYPDLALLATSPQGEIATALSWRGGEIDPEATAPAAGAVRGDPDDLDWYIFSGLSLSYNFIGGFKGKRGSRKSKKLKCPTF